MNYSLWKAVPDEIATIFNMTSCTSETHSLAIQFGLDAGCSVEGWFSVACLWYKLNMHRAALTYTSGHLGVVPPGLHFLSLPFLQHATSSHPLHWAGGGVSGANQLYAGGDFPYARGILLRQSLAILDSLCKPGTSSCVSEWEGRTDLIRVVKEIDIVSSSWPIKFTDDSSFSFLDWSRWERLEKLQI